MIHCYVCGVYEILFVYIEQFMIYDNMYESYIYNI